MKRYISIPLIFSAAFLGIYGFQAKTEFKYIGTNKCNECHSLEKYGNQTGIWANGPHAKSYKSLCSDFAKTHAKKILGTEIDPPKHEVCLSCHSTAGNAENNLKLASYDINEGVGCEGCHGPGSAYSRKNIMQSREKFLKNGGKTGYEDCQKCHRTDFIESCRKCHENNFGKVSLEKLKESYKSLLHPVN